jgi:hypothetical protein
LERQIAAAERALERELKIKAGAESLARHYGSKKGGGDRRHAAEAASQLQASGLQVDRLAATLARLRADHAALLGQDPTSLSTPHGASQSPVARLAYAHSAHDHNVVLGPPDEPRAGVGPHPAHPGTH